MVYDVVNASEAREPSRKAEVNVSIHAQEMEIEHGKLRFRTRQGILSGRAGSAGVSLSGLSGSGVDATAKLAVEMGGKVLVPPQDIPQVGRFCVLQDPQGATIKAITYVQQAA